jgi:hypothetical protein
VTPLRPAATRSLIDAGDKPHADAARFRRLRVTAGDSNMSETTTLLRVGAADLVLRMIEGGTIMPALTLDNLIPPPSGVRLGPGSGAWPARTGHARCGGVAPPPAAAHAWP